MFLPRPRSQVPIDFMAKTEQLRFQVLQGNLANKKLPTPLGSPWVPRYRATVGSYGEGGSYERGIPAGAVCPAFRVTPVTPGVNWGWASS